MALSSREIIKRLEKEGWERVRAKGDHIQFKHPVTNARVTIMHPVKDFKTGTLKSIFRQAGWK